MGQLLTQFALVHQLKSNTYLVMIMMMMVSGHIVMIMDIEIMFFSLSVSGGHLIIIIFREREGGPHNRADILLSLKNVIVHPGLSPQVNISSTLGE